MLQRIVFLDDGSVFGKYMDNCSALLQPNCLTATFIQADGEILRLITNTATKAMKIKLNHLISFRNMYSQHNPCIDVESIDNNSQQFKSHIAFNYIHWPTLDGEHFHNYAEFDENTGCVTVRSIENVVELKLASHEQCFEVHYPVLIKKSISSNINKEGKYSKTIQTRYDYEYLIQTQLFPVAAAPFRWEHPLKLALVYKKRWESQLLMLKSPTKIIPNPREMFKTPLTDLSNSKSSCKHSSSTQLMVINQCTELTQGVNDYTVELPVLQSISIDHNSINVQNLEWVDTDTRFSCIDNSDQILSKAHYTGGNNRYGLYQLHSLPNALPPALAVAIEWNHAAQYSILPCLHRVEILLHSDQSYLVYNAELDCFYHYSYQIISKTTNRRIYINNSFPTTEISAICTHAIKLLNHAISLQQSQQPKISENQLSLNPSRSGSLSSQLHYEEKVSQLGTFTAYTDGRIRVHYVDRTIATLSSDHSVIELILNNGLKCTMNSDNQDQQYQQYIQQMIKFSRYALLTSAQRREHLEAVQLQEQQIAQQLSSMRSYFEVQTAKRIVAGNYNKILTNKIQALR
jgi:hypothetical protein